MSFVLIDVFLVKLKILLKENKVFEAELVSKQKKSPLIVISTKLSTFIDDFVFSISSKKIYRP